MHIVGQQEKVQTIDAPEVIADAAIANIGPLGVWLTLVSAVTPLADGRMLNRPRPLVFARLSHQTARELHKMLGAQIELWDKQLAELKTAAN